VNIQNVVLWSECTHGDVRATGHVHSVTLQLARQSDAVTNYRMKYRELVC